MTTGGEEGLVPRSDSGLAPRSSALAHRVLDDLSGRPRRVLLISRHDEDLLWMVGSLERMDGIALVVADEHTTHEPPDIDLIADCADGRSINWRGQSDSRTPLLLVRRPWPGVGPLKGLIATHVDDSCDLAQALGPGREASTAGAEVRDFRDNVAIGIELGRAPETLRERERDGWQATVLWVGRDAGHEEALQELFAGHAYRILGATPETTARTFSQADVPVDVIVCPVGLADVALRPLAAKLRTNVPWIAQGDDTSHELRAEVLACLRGALPWSWLRMEPHEDLYAGLTELNPLADRILHRAVFVREAMLLASAAGRLSHGEGPSLSETAT